MGGGSGVNTNLEPGAKVMGTPAVPVRDWVKTNMILKSMLTKSGSGGKDAE